MRCKTHEIGTILALFDQKFKVVDQKREDHYLRCHGCYFHDEGYLRASCSMHNCGLLRITRVIPCFFGACRAAARKDKTNIIFKRVRNGTPANLVPYQEKYLEALKEVKQLRKILKNNNPTV